jgi:hypothetical protein
VHVVERGLVKVAIEARFLDGGADHVIDIIALSCGVEIRALSVVIHHCCVQTDWQIKFSSCRDKN